MNEQELQELRNWAARKMGLVPDKMVPGWFTDGHGLLLTNWYPDHPKSGQIWLVVERMRELGNTVLIGAKGKIYFCEIRENTYPVPMDSFYIENPNPCIAILKAARATEE